VIKHKPVSRIPFPEVSLPINTTFSWIPFIATVNESIAEGRHVFVICSENELTIFEWSVTCDLS